MSDTQEVIRLLKIIINNQEEASKFYVGTQLALVLAAAFAFVLALALNAALSLTFQQIPVGTDGLLGAWIYAILALIICILFMFIIYRYLQPWLHKKIDYPK